MQHLDVRVLHAHGQPFPRWTVAEREYLGREVVLFQLSTLPQIPRADRVVQSAGPQFRPVRRYVDARGAVRVALELSHQGLILKIPDGDAAVAAAAEANLRVRGDGQGVTGGGGRD